MAIDTPGGPTPGTPDPIQKVLQWVEPTKLLVTLIVMLIGYGWRQEVRILNLERNDAETARWQALRDREREQESADEKAMLKAVAETGQAVKDLSRRLP